MRRGGGGGGGGVGVAAAAGAAGAAAAVVVVVVVVGLTHAVNPWTKRSVHGQGCLCVFVGVPCGAFPFGGGSPGPLQGPSLLCGSPARTLCVSVWVPCWALPSGGGSPAGALPSVWVPCGVPPVGDPLWGPPLRYLTTLLCSRQLCIVARKPSRGLLAKGYAIKGALCA